MSLGNVGGSIAMSFAGLQTSQQQQSQASGQSAQASANQNRGIQSKENAAKAEGVGEEDDQKSEASGDRDADGRRAWERRLHQQGHEGEHRDRSLDPTGQTGNSLDLCG
ncbi:MAG: hypothetical protein ACRC10_07190 [Thermoguttaceae bacterium]